MRTVGIEEELLVVDAESGRPVSVAERVRRDAASPNRLDKAGLGGGPNHAPGEPVGAELNRQQVETGTSPCADMEELDADVRRWRSLATTTARQHGAKVVAAATSPVEVEPDMERDPRYQEIREWYGLTVAEHLTCGFHTHVSVEGPEEGVAVLDRIRAWLPPLLALSANSPYWQGKDTSYASFRSQAMVRWPSAGPSDVFGSAQAYHAMVAAMVESGVLLDEGMVYFDARLSRHYPTLEVRVADVCLHAEDAVLIAALCRGLVDTAAREWADGTPPPDVPTAMIRLAGWQAGRAGLEGNLLDPMTSQPRKAADVLGDLVRHVRAALEDNGDADLVDERLAAVLARGNGAQRQRSVFEKTGRLSDVVADLARVTAGTDG